MANEGIECPACGETNRKGLFRCWKCKAPLTREVRQANAPTTDEMPASLFAPKAKQDLEVCRACGEIVPQGMPRCPKCKMLVTSELDRVFRESVEKKHNEE